MKTIGLLTSVMLLITAVLVAADVPAVLPDPNGALGDAAKPVEVYILAGQSNMVGMGDIGGAKNVYTGVFLRSDPAISEGPFQIYKVGNYKVSQLNTFTAKSEPTEEPIAEGHLNVPHHGVYELHCGFGKSSFCTMWLNGKEVYRRESGAEPIKQQITLEPDERYSFRISGFSGEPPRFWMQKADLLGNGDLQAVARGEGKFPWLVNDAGEWTVRNDVYFQEARLSEGGKGSPLSATSNGKSIGPELGFGHVLGEFHNEQVLLIKTAQGNRLLGFDFRPPSSGRTENQIPDVHPPIFHDKRP